MAMRMGPALGSPTIVMLAAVPGILGGFPAARPHWRCRANVWRGRTSPAGGPRRLTAHDGSSHLLDLRLGIEHSTGEFRLCRNRVAVAAQSQSSMTGGLPTRQVTRAD